MARSNSPGASGRGPAFEFSRGWCALRLGEGDAARSLSATNLLDCFSFLVEAVVDLARGRTITSCLWLGEPGGWFIDFSQLGSSRCSLVVHEMKHKGWIADDPWIPVRAKPVFETAADRAEFFAGLIAAFRRVRIEYVDHVGYMPEWGWRFPEQEFEFLEKFGRSLGYRPQPSA